MNQKNRQEPAEALVRGTVSRGNSIEVPYGPRVPVGTDDKGNQVFRQKVKTHGPGEEIELPADEMARLRSTGAIVDPRRPALPLSEGPQYEEREMGQVRG